MKTNLSTLLFLIGFIFYAHAQTQKVNVEVSFSGTRCNGSHGLCVVEPSSSKTATSCVYLNEEGFMVMEIDKETLSSQDRKKVLAHKKGEFSYFIMEDTFVLQDELRQLLNLPIDKGEIPKGSYKVIDTGKTYLLIFPVR